MSNKIVTDTEDKDQIKKAEERMKRAVNGLRALLRTADGRSFLYEHIYVTCHKNGCSHVPGNPNTTDFNEGARQVGVQLEEIIKEMDLDLWLKMHKENDPHG